MISAKFVPLKYYTLSSQLRRLTSFSVGLFGSANSVTRSYPVMRKSCIGCNLPVKIWSSTWDSQPLVYSSKQELGTSGWETNYWHAMIENVTNNHA